jgi:hypothetical protein
MSIAGTLPNPNAGDAFTSIVVVVNWKDVPSAHDMSALLLSLQAAYEIISEETESPPTLLRVTHLNQPNMLLTITGVTAAIMGLKGWLGAHPEVITGLLTFGTALVGARRKKEAAPTPPVVIVVQQNSAELIGRVEKRLGDMRFDDAMRKEVTSALLRDAGPIQSTLPLQIASVQIAPNPPPGVPPRAASYPTA